MRLNLIFVIIHPDNKSKSSHKTIYDSIDWLQSIDRSQNKYIKIKYLAKNNYRRLMHKCESLLISYLITHNDNFYFYLILLSWSNRLSAAAIPAVSGARCCCVYESQCAINTNRNPTLLLDA